MKIDFLSKAQLSLKIDRLKFTGPLGQPNSMKIDIDLTQDILLPTTELAYHNIYRVPVTVKGMDLIEICAEKMRAVNERARYRDFYDLTMCFKKKGIEPESVISTLKKKELRKPLSADNILKNLEVAQIARDRGLENLFYREKINKEEIQQLLDKLLPLL